MKEVLIIKEEFYKSNEYNKTNEYLHFPAEIYPRKIEENALGAEESDVGAEVTTLQTSNGKRNQPKNTQKNLIDKIFNSMKGVATISTVAVVAVYGSSMTVPESGTSSSTIFEPLPSYEMTVSNVLFSGINEVEIYFEHEGLENDCELELLLDYGDGRQEKVLLTQRNLVNGYVKAPIASDAQAVSIQPIIQYGEGKTMTFEPYYHLFEKTLEADVKVDNVNGLVNFYLKGITGDATYINVMNLVTEEVETQDLYWDSVAVNSVMAFYEIGLEDFVNYSLFLTNEEGGRVSNEYTVSVDTTKTMKNDSKFNFLNTGDVGITYNDDGTINVYIDTQFETANEELYYTITLGDKLFASRDKIFCARGLPNQNYGITYDVCFNVDGMHYSILSVTPSGTINEMTFDGVLDANLTDSGLNLSIYSFIAEGMDLNEIWLTTPSGERIDLTESHFVYNEETDSYECNVSISQEFAFVEVYVVYAPYAQNMAGIEGYEGSLSATFTKRIDKS